jgi:hypothetical protein
MYTLSDNNNIYIYNKTAKCVQNRLTKKIFPIRRIIVLTFVGVLEGSTESIHGHIKYDLREWHVNKYYKNYNMADLEILEQFLDIDTDNKRLRNGKKKYNKNQYYYYRNQFYIVKLTKDKWMVCSDDDNTRRLLRLYTWYFHPNGYAATKIKQSTKRWHQVYLTYQHPNVADHINNKKFDNRSQNFRIVSHRENARNLTKRKTNTSGKQGVRRYVANGWSYWKAQIRDDEGNQISKHYSIAKYGDDEAKQLAINQRLEWQKKYNYIGD